MARVKRNGEVVLGWESRNERLIQVVKRDERVYTRDFGVSRKPAADTTSLHATPVKPAPRSPTAVPINKKKPPMRITHKGHEYVEVGITEKSGSMYRKFREVVSGRIILKPISRKEAKKSGFSVQKPTKNNSKGSATPHKKRKKHKKRKHGAIGKRYNGRPAPERGHVRLIR